MIPWKLIAIISLIANAVVIFGAFQYLRSPLAELNNIKDDVTDVCALYEDNSSSLLDSLLSQANVGDRVEELCADQ